ncbi:PepSY domain-containing protein [Parabacteroides faecis]|nr:PepSY-associated TM helix domain-containing protein [Parabacteroides faecis]MCS2892101.1 PepSY domain-containing protein [Parabacteroides faecis]
MFPVYFYIQVKKYSTSGKGKKPGVRCYRLHIVIGLFTALFLFLIAFTGCYFGFKKEFHTVFESVSSGKALQPAP